ncbi:MAG: hypothetical protein H6621_00835 [Halobacteriovoraceae bacterium]|nr:hypothetical protein [Halobacteriovoraceae bacterium]MCB9093586.1 hypothetical protein [Halobacteriovoraceae bacterium]
MKKLFYFLIFSFIIATQGWCAKEGQGEVIDCLFDCTQNSNKVKRALSYGRPLYTDQLIETGSDSSLWFYLYNGAMFRMGPDTHIKISELALTPEESLTVVEYFQGNLLALPRLPFQEINEQDSTKEIFPLQDTMANPYWDLYELNEKKGIVNIDFKGKDYFEFRNTKLLNLFNQNDEYLNKKKHHLLIIAPTAIINAINAPVELFFEPGKDLVVSLRNDWGGYQKISEKVKVQLTHNNFQDVSLKTGHWYRLVDQNKKFEVIKKRIDAIEHSLYLKNFPSMIYSREKNLQLHNISVKALIAEKNIDELKEKIVLNYQKKPLNISSFIQQSLNKSKEFSISQYNNFFIHFNKEYKKYIEQFESISFVEVWQISSSQKRKWLMGKKIDELRESNRKILSSLRKR